VCQTAARVHQVSVRDVFWLDRVSSAYGALRRASARAERCVRGVDETVVNIHGALQGKVRAISQMMYAAGNHGRMDARLLISWCLVFLSIPPFLGFFSGIAGTPLYRLLKTLCKLSKSV
jgi:hypothetical protein